MSTTDSQRRPRFFYGWTIVGAVFAINIVGAPLTPVIFAFFVGPMSEDLGWSRGAISWAITFRMVGSGLAAPFLGGFGR